MSKILYKHKWMKLCEDNNHEAFVKMNEDAVMIVAITRDQEVLLIREKSIAYQVNRLTLPTGSIEIGELPEITANRELQEEIGYRARRMEYIGTLHPSFKYIQWQCHIYLARDLKRSQLKGDETSPIEVQAVLIDSIDAHIANRVITDSTTIAALMMVQKHLLLETRLHSFNTVFVSS